MAETAQDTIERFQQLDLTTEEARAAMDLTPKAMQLFVILLDYIIEGTLEIKDLGKVMEKFKFASPYAQVLKKAGVITNGEKRGTWLFTEEAVGRMRAIVDGEPIAKKAATTRKKPGPKPRKERPTSPPSTAKKARTKDVVSASPAAAPTKKAVEDMTVGEIKARRHEIDSLIIALADEYDGLSAGLSEIIAMSKKKANRRGR